MDTSSPWPWAAYRPMTASAATYCTLPASSASKASFRLSVGVRLDSPNPLETAQALFEETWAAKVAPESWVGVPASGLSANRAMPVGR